MAAPANLASRPSPSLRAAAGSVTPPLTVPPVVLSYNDFDGTSWSLEFSCDWTAALPDHSPILFMVRDLSPWGGPTTNLSASALTSGLNLRTDVVGYYGAGGGELDVWAVIDREGIQTAGPVTRHTIPD